ncbi:LysM peptidoglycan-binding domain-containing protein [Halopseudomonas maritima]|uniref:type IV pilus assembly protein FimV n=1 Tax=Halopseudomonas maritima TaxID=2918528 RepID=UPI001EEA09F8|nr:FimV/HubP family polar landmark protein [Halopseudomonas maritima]UJJ31906.1 LysM peptidoglycan-binding domain-containing protein [Halopseudomonas maritima]
MQGAEGLGPTDVVIKLADSSAFDAAGIDRPYFLTGLQFTPVVENRQLTVRVSSTQPVREPYLNFLVELRRPSGTLLREYTVLLDPPLYSEAAPVAVNPVVSAPPPRSRVAARPAESAPRPEAATLPDLTPQPGADSYTTVSGDSLWTIAERTRPTPVVSINQTMTAIHSLNRGAFVNGDIDRLKLGQTLILPTAEQLGGGAGDQAPASLAEASDAADGDAGAQQRMALQSSQASTGEQVDGASQNEGPSALEVAQHSEARLRIEEDDVSEAEVESAQLQSRLTDLEGRFNALLSELDARDRQIAALQAELEVLRAAREAEQEQAAALAGAAGSLGSGGGGSDASPYGSDDPAAGAIAAEMPAAAEESKSSGMLWWSLLVGLLAFLVGWAVSRLRGKPRPSAPAPGSTAPLSGRDAPVTSVSAAAAAGVAGASAGGAFEDSAEGVDLYITYGRFAEARELLDKTIADDPDNLELRFKQARVTGELGDAQGFAEQASAIARLDGDMQRVDQLKARYPQLETSSGAPLDTVEDVLADGELGSAEQGDVLDAGDTPMNLNDFTLDPDWDLIEGLTPAPSRKAGKGADEAMDNEPFESSLHEFPEIEELDEHHSFNHLEREDSKR